MKQDSINGQNFPGFVFRREKISMIRKFAEMLFHLAILFLPWQTAMIITHATVLGEPSQYGVFSIYVVEVMIGFVFLLRGRTQTQIQTQKVGRALWFFLAAVFFSLGFSQVEWVGWFHAIHVVSATMLFLLLVDERTDIRRVLLLFLLGLLVPVILGWYQTLSGTSPDSALLGLSVKDAMTPGVAVVETGEGRLLRAYGTFPHPNIFGGYLAFGIIALSWISRFVRTRYQLCGTLIASALLGATLIVVFSRSAWLGLFLALLALISIMLWQGKMPPRRALPIMILGLISILSTFIVFHSQVFSRFDFTQRLEVISVEERAGGYRDFGEVFVQSPIFGVGPSAYTFILERLDTGHPLWSYQPVHNVYLLLLAELGLIGIAAFGYLIFCINPMAHGSIKRTGTLFADSAWILLFVIGLFDHYLWSFWSGLAFISFAMAVILKWSNEPLDRDQS